MKPLKLTLLLTLLCIIANTTRAQTISYTTPGTYTYVVPTGVTSLVVDMAGAQGGMGYPSGPGGKGGRMQCVLAVTPGNTLSIYVGGTGVAAGTVSGPAPGGVNGTGGGANGGAGGPSNGGGGGGSTDIRMGGTALLNRVIVAAGGGGATNVGVGPEWGGNGGGINGVNGTYSGTYAPTQSGAGGTQVSGGVSASSCGTTNGALGAGGNGAAYGAGGGGGYWGGGGGCYGSGGGGSSYPPAPTPYCTSVTTTAGYNTGNGWVNLTNGCMAISGASAPLCAGTTTTLSATPAGGTWSSSSTGVATIGSSSGILTAGSPGTAIITCSVTGCSVSVAVTVNPVPVVSPIAATTATVCIGTNITLTDAVPGGAWSASNANATVTAGVVHGVSAGTVGISYTVSNSCGTAVADTLITVTSCPSLGAGSLVQEHDIRIYPNPVSDELMIDAGQSGCSTYRITNTIGQQVSSGALTGAQTKVNTAALPAGMYYVTLSGADADIVRRFVKM